MKVNAIIRLLVMILTAGRAHVTICSSLHGNDTDMLSLLEFKKTITLDPHQALMSWNDSTHYCNWEGVHCRLKNPRRVISLDLSYQGLVGQISPSLGNLTILKYLALSDNAFTAEIPPFLGHLRHLRYLFLSNNTLQGRIPSFASCSSLEALLLNGNHLVGQIPVNWSPRLQSLDFSANNLTGTIHASFANLSMLIEFRCTNNKIEGDIPNTFAKFHSLQFLYIGNNLLSGRFPQAILNLSTLAEVSLTSNSFSGQVPPSLGNYLPNLELLFLAINLFQGNIPPPLTNASKLHHVDISENNFTGVVPVSIGKLSKLSTLNLEVNKLIAHSKQDWVFMNSLANCTELRVILIYANRFEGQIPASIGNLSVQLQALH
jgi:Leucine-rich repeat (LRR) protein